MLRNRDGTLLPEAEARPLLAGGGTVRCGFDRDATGEAMAQAMIARHPAIHRLRPAYKDWNDVLRVGG